MNLCRNIKSHFVLMLLGFLISGQSSSATNYYISNDGSDYYNGTSPQSAWKTIEKVNRSSFLPGDSILFKRGHIFHGGILIKHSGTLSSPIVFSSYGEGHKAKITGLSRVSGWQFESNGIYSCILNAPDDLNLLLINNEPQSVGRFPNTGWLCHESATTTTLTDKNLPQEYNWTNAELVVKYNEWVIGRGKILDHSVDVITFVNNTGMNNYKPNVGSHFGYFIQRDLKTLDQFGEWFYSKNKLYIYTGDKTPDSFDIKISTIQELIQCNMKSNIHIKALHFEGSNKYSIYVDYCKNLIIDSCIIQTSGTDAVHLRWNINNAKITRNIIKNTQGKGLFLQGHSDAKNIYIAHNKIINSGLVPGMAGKAGGYHGFISQGSTDIIEYNYIENCGYNGLEFGGNGSTVRYNIIKKSNMLLSDGASLYTYKHTNEYYDNVTNIYNNIAINSYSQSFYSDGYSSKCHWINNTSINCKGFGFLMNTPRQNIVKSNVFYNCQKSPIYVSNYDASTNSENNSFTENIIFHSIKGKKFQEKALFTLYDPHNTNVYSFGESSKNTFILDGAVDTFIHTTKRINGQWKGDYLQLSNWQTSFSKDNDSDTIHIYKKPECFINTNTTTQTININGIFNDILGHKYQNVLTLEPYRSIILFPKNTYEQNVDFIQGWNLFSTYIAPHNPQTLSVFSELMSNNLLIKIQDEKGNSVERLSNNSNWLDQVNSINPIEGYKIYVTDSCSILIRGEKVNEGIQKTLNKGWNLVPYINDKEMNWQDYISPLTSEGIFLEMKDSNGGRIKYDSINNIWTNSIGELKPGKAYEIKISSEVIFDLN